MTVSLTIVYKPCKISGPRRASQGLRSCDGSDGYHQIRRADPRRGLRAFPENMAAQGPRGAAPVSRTSGAVPAVSFATLLRSRAMPSLTERRRLALTFAYSLMQLHESPWLSGKWENKRMHFFHTASGGFDLERSFLCASFDQFAQEPQPGDLDPFHRNAGILRLGILLIDSQVEVPRQFPRRERPHERPAHTEYRHRGR